MYSCQGAEALASGSFQGWTRNREPRYVIEPTLVAALRVRDDAWRGERRDGWMLALIDTHLSDKEGLSLPHGQGRAHAQPRRVASVGGSGSDLFVSRQFERRAREGCSCARHGVGVDARGCQCRLKEWEGGRERDDWNRDDSQRALPRETGDLGWLVSTWACNASGRYRK